MKTTAKWVCTGLLLCFCGGALYAQEILDFHPKSGRVGDVITIKVRDFLEFGTLSISGDTELYQRSFVGFGGRYDANSVGATSAYAITYPIEVNSDATELKVRVPIHARTGSLSITQYVAGSGFENTSSSEVFTVIDNNLSCGCTSEIEALEAGNTTQNTKIATLEAGKTAQDTKITTLEAEIEKLKAALAASNARVQVFSVPTRVRVQPQIYPNPTAEGLSFRGLSSTERYSYKIYTVTGVLVDFGVLPLSHHLQLTRAPGQYLLVLLDEQQTELLKTSVLIE